MADDKGLTPTAGVVQGGSIEPSDSTVSGVKDIKETKIVNNTSKEVKPNNLVKNTVKSTIETFKIQEVVESNVIINFYGHRITLPNKDKKLGDSIEIEYSGSKQKYNIVNYK